MVSQSFSQLYSRALLWLTTLQRIHLKQQESPCLCQGQSGKICHPNPWSLKRKDIKDAEYFSTTCRDQTLKKTSPPLQEATTSSSLGIPSSRRAESPINSCSNMPDLNSLDFTKESCQLSLLLHGWLFRTMAPQLFQVILTSQIAENGSLLPLGVGQFSYVNSTKPLFENPLNFFDNLRRGSNYMQSGCQHWKRTGRSATAGSEQPKLIADTNSVTNHPYPRNTSQYTETMTTYTKTLVQLLNRFRILTPSVLKFQCGDLYIIHNSGLTVFKPSW